MKKILCIALVVLVGCGTQKYVPTKDILSNGDTLYSDKHANMMYLRPNGDTIWLLKRGEVMQDSLPLRFK